MSFNHVEKGRSSKNFGGLVIHAKRFALFLESPLSVNKQ